MTPDQRIVEFKQYITSLIRMFIPDIETFGILNVVEQFIDDENKMKIWLNAFTHVSRDANGTANYEQLETIGDASMNSAFKDYLVSRFPFIPESVLSERKASYMSKEFQSIIGEKMKVDRWVRKLKEYPVTTAMYEDVSEAFCGALGLIGDLILDGLGKLLVKKLIAVIFDKTVFTDDLDYGTSSTILFQASQGTSWKIEEGSGFRNVRGGIEYTYNLSGFDFDEYIRMLLRIHGQESNPLDRYNFRASGFSRMKGKEGKAEAKNLAGDQILNQMLKYGITKKMIKSNDIRLKSLYKSNRDTCDQAIATAKQDKYQRLYTRQDVDKLSAEGKAWVALIGYRTEKIPGSDQEIEINNILQSKVEAYRGNNQITMIQLELIGKYANEGAFVRVDEGW